MNNRVPRHFTMTCGLEEESSQVVENYKYNLLKNVKEEKEDPELGNLVNEQNRPQERPETIDTGITRCPKCLTL